MLVLFCPDYASFFTFFFGFLDLSLLNTKAQPFAPLLCFGVFAETKMLSRRKQRLSRHLLLVFCLCSKSFSGIPSLMGFLHFDERSGSQHSNICYFRGCQC